jgi:hypothetical protein
MMYVIYISVFFYRYANHVCVNHTVRTNHRDECDLPPTIRTPTIFSKLLLLVRTYMTSRLSWHYILMLHKENEL